MISNSPIVLRLQIASLTFFFNKGVCKNLTTLEPDEDINHY